MKRIAAIVGNDKYRDERYSNLKNARADAKRVERFLREELPEGLRFQTKLLLNPTAGEVSEYLESVLRQLDDASTFVFYFAGHGLFHRSSGKQMLLCRDALGTLAEGFDGTGALTLDYMRSFSQRGKGNMFFCYDVCRKEVETGHRGNGDVGGAGAFRDATSEAPNAAYGGAGLRWSLSSCGERELARDDGSFVDALLSAMKSSLATRREIKLGDELVEGVVKSLRARGCRQTPEPRGNAFALVSLAPSATWNADQVPRANEGASDAKRASSKKTTFLWATAALGFAATAFWLRGAMESSKTPETVVNPGGVAQETANLSETTSPVATETPREEKDENVAKAAKLFEEAKKLEGEKNYSDALAKMKDAEKLDPDNAEYASYATSLETQNANVAKAKTLFDEAKKLEGEKKYAEALAMMKDAEKLDPQNSSYASYAATLEAKAANAVRVKQLFDEAKKLEGEKKYSEALAKMEAAKTLEPDVPTYASYAAQLAERVKEATASPTPPSSGSNATTASLPEKILDALGQRFVLIHPESFMMGNTLSADEIVKRWGGEKIFFENAPRHKVTLTRPYYMQQYPVTRGDFAKFVKATGYKTTAEQKGSAWGCDKDGTWKYIDGLNWRNPGFSQSDDHPVVCVSWNDAQKYVEWLNKTQTSELPPGFRYALPTEAQWEYACRAGTDTEFFWGTNDENDGKGYLNAADESGSPVGTKWSSFFPFNDGYQATSPVGKFKPNNFGLYDMLGNVWEWCADWYGDYPSGAQTDPQGASSGSYRVLRGGSWGSGPRLCRSAGRSYYLPAIGDRSNGFRLAMTGESAASKTSSK